MHPVNSEIIIQSTVINWNKSNRYPELQHLGSKLRSLNFKSKMKREEPNLDIHKNTKNSQSKNISSWLFYSWNNIKIKLYASSREDKVYLK